MFLKIFNWLVKRTPYTFAFISLGFTWTVLVASFGACLILIGADFRATGTREIFILLLSINIGIASFFTFLEYGLLRLFGIKWERPKLKVLNENIIKGHFHQDVSNKALLESLYSLNNITKWTIIRNIQYGHAVVISCGLGEWVFSAQFTNVPIVLIGLLIASYSLYIYGSVFYESLISPARKECKILLFNRGINFEEPHFISLSIKSKFFIVLIGFALLAILIIIHPLNLSLVILSLLTLIIIGLLTSLVFRSIYNEFTEIEELAKDLTTSKRVLFFSGSSDKEILDLSQSLNKTAQEISKYQTALEEEKASLEIKVKARTKELQELTQGLDQKVKERTKELQDRVSELEKFHRLTVGRELKMVELKQKIKELEEKLGKNK